MPPDNTTGNRVGMGVDLLGGPEVLSMLQQIRTEMQAIASLSGRGQRGGDIYGGNRQTQAEFEQDIRKREQIELDSIKRIARARQEAARPITDREVNAFADKKQRQAELNRQINQRITDDERRAAQEREKIRLQEEDRKYRASAEYAKKRKDLANQLASGPNIAIDPLQRSVFRNARNDPFSRSDPTTQQWREEYATVLRAAGIQRDKLSAENAAMRKLQEERRNLLSQPTQTRGSYGLYDAVSNAQAAEIRGDETLAAFNKRVATRGTREWADAMKDQYSLEQQAQALSINSKAVRGKTLKNIEDIDQSTLRAMLRSGNVRSTGSKGGTIQYDASSFGISGGGGGGPTPASSGGGPRRPRTPDLRDPQGLFNEKGFFTTGEALGRITRNILIYEVISRATYGLANYVKESIEAAKQTDDLSRAMAFATEQAGGNVQANQNLVESLKAVGASRIQGLQAVTEASRFAEFAGANPNTIPLLAQTATNIAATRGFGVGNTGQLIEQLLRRGERGVYKQVFGITPSEIYENYARQQLQGQTTSPFTTPGLYTDTSRAEPNEKFKTLTERVKEYTASMSDAEKEAAAYNYILSQSSRFQDEAAERANSLAGRIDKIGAAFENAKGDVGQFVTEIKPVSDFLEYLTGKAGLLEVLRAPQLGHSGQGGTISDLDRLKFVQQSTTGTRAGLLNTINDFGVPALGLGAGIAGSCLFGRGQAVWNVRNA
jgi:hypothetical protein